MAAFDTRSDAELLTATALEPESFGIFYRRHVGQVLAYTLTRTRRPELAADLTAEVFAPAPAPLTPAPGGSARTARPASPGSGDAPHSVCSRPNRTAVRLGLLGFRVQAGEYTALFERLPRGKRPATCAARSSRVASGPWKDITTQCVSEPWAPCALRAP